MQNEIHHRFNVLPSTHAQDFDRFDASAEKQYRAKQKEKALPFYTWVPIKITDDLFSELDFDETTTNSRS